ncbi:stage II sporulation protein D [Bacillus massilinigeriensis]|uniref:stage II sporulation protein D n=1 Tax=Bacillus massilionigeriensis TaxID=1805475 RepID=UPI00096B13CE|nr:stage II sporulation protein D [Bacillus massilionigeriensis]
MTKIKPIIVLAIILFSVTLLVPSLLVIPFSEEKASGQLKQDVTNEQKPKAKETVTEPAVEVSVYRMEKQKLETLPLDEYVVGVVASEMPADFEMEALKAQALTARTYIVKQLLSNQKSKLPEGALVSDTVIHQVYKNEEDLKRVWGMDYKWKLKKIKEAVEATSGEIITYDHSPIDATFFSTSNGYTEDSGEIWPNQLSYLKSVESPWDQKSPKFNGQKIMRVKEFEKILGVKLTDNNIGTITERTEGKRVGKVEIDGKTFKGEVIREKLGLQSTDFSWERKGDSIFITTKGNGHGVGMSQYGANGMAQEGKTYKQIVKYYYNGVQISPSKSYLNKITVKK